MTRTTFGHELRALNAMNNIGLWMICTSLSREFNDLDVMKSLGVMDDMNNFGP